MKRKVSGHHLVYGTLKDYLTGEELPDTDDERFRQDLERMMVEEKGFSRQELEPRRVIETTFNKIFVRSIIDLTVSVGGKQLFVLRYGPGSLVTREKPALAAARVLEPDYCIPLAVVTNGRDAELLETATGKVLATGMESIPDRKQAEQLLAEFSCSPPDDKSVRERTLRVLNAFDLEVCCRNDTCSLPTES
jgi:hypothetical protein